MSNKDNYESLTLYEANTSLINNFNFTPFLVLYSSIILYAAAFLESNETIFTLKIKTYRHEFYHYHFCLFATTVIVSAHLLSLLVKRWSLQFRLRMSYRKTNSVHKATHIFVKSKPHCGPSQICPLTKTDGEISFSSHKIKHKFDAALKAFLPVSYPTNKPLTFYTSQKGLQSGEIQSVRNDYGRNVFEVPKITFLKLYVEHITAPFFVFQMFVICLWSLDGYFSYSLVIIGMLFMFEATMAFRRLKNLAEVRNMRFPSTLVNVLRDGEWAQIRSKEILPGDLLSLRADKDFPSPCDVLLLKGNCVVNESLLTGESTPQLKDSLENQLDLAVPLDLCKAHRRHLVSSGTFVLSCSNTQRNDTAGTSVQTPDKGVLGVAIQTAYSTNQGKLLRTILYSTEKTSYGENKEVFLFLSMLLFFSVSTAIFVFLKGIEKPNVDVPELLLNCVMIVTMVIPTELPMVLSMAINDALMDLTKKKVFCSEGHRVPHAGSLSLCCFDKTGTLTRDEFCWKGLVRIENGQSVLVRPETVSPQTTLIVGGCHSLSLIEGEVQGDPLEAVAFKGCRLSMNANGVSNWPKGRRSPLSATAKSIRIVRRFPFSSEKKRMSCVVLLKSPRGQEVYFVSKGAAEKMKALLKKIPGGYDSVAEAFSAKGHRIITAAWKKISHSQMDSPLKTLETELTFEGFLVFDSPLREDSKETVVALRKAGHKCLMVTGDNILTANFIAAQTRITTKNPIIVKLAKNSSGELILANSEKDQILTLKKIHEIFGAFAESNDLSITGDCFELLWERLDHSEIGSVLWNFRVFARMSPSQKERLLRSFRQIGMDVLMCGDGTNDVGALKQANVGIALAENTQEDRETAEREKKKGKKGKFDDLLRKEKSKSPLQQMIDDLIESTSKEEEDEADKLHVNMNVASIASPFTSRSGFLSSVIDIVRQGRRTLVINLQMYQILALNCLISSLLFSYLYLSDQKMSDAQATFSEMIVTVLFMFVASAKPLELVSIEVPRSRVMTLYTAFNLFSQLSVHLLAIFGVKYLSEHFETVSAVQNATSAVSAGGNLLGGKINITAAGVAANIVASEEFKSSIGNTMAFHLAAVMQITTFACNYVGEPFMQSLSDNKRFSKALIASVGFTVLVLSEFSPELNDYLQLKSLVHFKEFPFFLLLLLFDFAAVYALERLSRFAFGEKANAMRLKESQFVND